MKFKWIITCLLLTVVVAFSCREKKENPSNTENPNEDIMESKQEGMEQTEEWKGEDRTEKDTASYENRQGHVSEQAKDRGEK